MTKYRETEFIPANWVDIAAASPGLQVYSRPVCVPVSVPQRRKNDPGVPTLTVDEIEGLLRTALLPEKPPFESIDLNHVEELLAAYEN